MATGLDEQLAIQTLAQFTELDEAVETLVKEAEQQSQKIA
jgi:hypothetical protein